MKKYCLMVLFSCISFCFAQAVNLDECHKLIDESKYYAAEKMLAEKLKTETDADNLEILIKEYENIFNTIETASEQYNRDFFIPLLKEGEKSLTASKVYDFYIGNFKTETDNNGNKSYYLTSNIIPSMDFIQFTENILIPYKKSYSNSWSENAPWPEFSDFYVSKNEIDPSLYIAEYNGHLKNSVVSFIKVPEATKTETITFYKIQFSIKDTSGTVLYRSPKVLVKQNGTIQLSGLTEKAAEKIAAGDVQYELTGVWILSGTVPQIDFGLGKSVEECIKEINSHSSEKTLAEMDVLEAFKELSSSLSEFEKLQKQIDSFDWDKWSSGLKETPLNAAEYKLLNYRKDIDSREKEFVEETKAIYKNVNSARIQKIKDKISTDHIADISFDMVSVQGKEFTATEWNYSREKVYSANISSFMIGSMEVTEELFEKVTGIKNDKVTDKKLPAVMSWNDAVVFCNLISMQTGLQPCYSIDGVKDPAKWNYEIGKEVEMTGTVTCDFYADGYRLPTEAEWSLAANYGNPDDYSFAGTKSKLISGWIIDSTDSLMEGGQKICNNLGLFDMTGNVSEWCFDSFVYFSDWNFGKQPVMNPVVITENNKKVIRGGSYNSDIPFDERNYSEKYSTYFSTTGLRLVRTTTSQIQERKQADEAYKQELIQQDSADKLKLDDFVNNGFVQVPDSIYYEGVYYPLKNTLPGFKMWKTEVTQEIYKYVTGSIPNEIEENNIQENYPVCYVNWNEAAAFCNLLSVKYNLDPCFSYEGRTDPADWPRRPDFEKFECDFSKNGFRLPTILEWEAAAKSAEADTEYKYASTDNLDSIAWYSKNSNETLHEAATKKPNPLGIYDLCGNVEEWCWDTVISFGSKYKAKKGGSYDTGEYFCDISHTESSKYSSFRTGFRIVSNSTDR